MDLESLRGAGKSRPLALASSRPQSAKHIQAKKRKASAKRLAGISRS